MSDQAIFSFFGDGIGSVTDWLPSLLLLLLLRIMLVIVILVASSLLLMELLILITSSYAIHIYSTKGSDNIVDTHLSSTSV